MAGVLKRLRIAVFFGGRSAEHDVSLMSATNVMNALDPAKYDAIPIYVTHEGKWFLSTFSDGALSKPTDGTQLCLIAGGQGQAIAIPADGAPHEFPKIDAIFPVLHGLHGEDGTIQGLAEVVRIPLIGCSITGSVNALDKDLAKQLFKSADIPAAKSVTIHQGKAPSFAALKQELGLPIFIKPARQGSSVGVSKVNSEADLSVALEEGFRHDNKLLAEEFIQAREIECGVLEDEKGNIFVSRTGEIATATNHGFYTYDAKYIDQNGAILTIPAGIPAATEHHIQALAAKAFRALGCDSMARVDFFVTQDMRVLLNEVNTIPGFTDISMYAKVMAASGISYPEVLDRLIAHGMARAS